MKLNEKQIIKIKDMYKNGRRVIEIATKFDVSPATISYHINDDYKKNHIKNVIENFRNKSLKERRVIYKKRLVYLRDYQRIRYQNDPIFREKKRRSKWKNKDGKS